MSILAALGGRKMLLRSASLRVAAKLALRLRVGSLGQVAEAFEGTFRFHGYGISGKYELTKGDTIGEILYWYGLPRFEPTTIPLFIEQARAARGVLDIGANSGLYTLLACSANARASVMAWEPVPFLAGKTRRNIAINDFGGRCHFRQAAAGNSDEQRVFFISDDDTMSSFSEKQAAGKGHIATRTMVACERIDSVIGDFPVDLIKIDVEGHEYEALSGGARSIERWRPKIFFECLRQTDPLPLQQLFADLKYQLHQVTRAGLVPVDSISAERTTDNNYFAAPRH